MTETSFFPFLRCEATYRCNSLEGSESSLRNLLVVFRSALSELLAAVGIVSTFGKLVAFFSASFSSWQRGHSPESDLICFFDVTSTICTVLCL
jgi:hypothetical protein